jgi:putative ABC transport system permease protein
LKYLLLLWAAVWRNPVETLLTWLAACAAFALFSLMVGLYVHTRQVILRQRMDRLYVVMRYPDQPYTGLPISLAGQIAQVKGVTAVSAVHWLHGYHADPKTRISVMAVDRSMPLAYPELPLGPADWQRLFARPDAAFASRRAAQRFGLRPGTAVQVTTPQDTQADGNPTRVFQVLGLIDDIPEMEQGFLLGNHAYVDGSEAPQRRGLGNMFRVATVDGKHAATVCRAIDERFASSGAPTYCVPAQADAQAMANSNVDIAAITLAVAGAGLFMIFFLIANGIARSVSERVPELAVLQTVGFRPWQLQVLVMLEAALPCLLGAALGTSLGYALTRSSIPVLTGNLGRLLTTPEFPPQVLLWSAGSAALLALGSSVAPLRRLARLSVVDALAGR